jgi:hypothetical protein
MITREDKSRLPGCQIKLWRIRERLGNEAKKAAEAYGRAEDERLKKAVEEIQGGR